MFVSYTYDNVINNFYTDFLLHCLPCLSTLVPWSIHSSVNNLSIAYRIWFQVVMCKWLGVSMKSFLLLCVNCHYLVSPVTIECQQLPFCHHCLSSVTIVCPLSSLCIICHHCVSTVTIVCHLWPGESHPCYQLLHVSGRLLLCHQRPDWDLSGGLLLSGGHGPGLAGVSPGHLQWPDRTVWGEPVQDVSWREVLRLWTPHCSLW